MSRKKTPKGKGASAPAASALPAANGPRPALPGTARPGPGTPHNAPPQPGRPPVGSGGDFYDVAFKLSDPGSGCPASGKACPWPLPPAGRTNKGSRVMLVGDSGVGKTCLLVRFKDGAFLAGTFISTVGIDFRNKVLDVDGMKVKLSGTQLARSVSAVSLTPTTVTHMHCCCSMMSPTRPPSTTSSFPHQAWLAEIQEYAQHDVVLMLLGNKFLSMAQDPTSVPRRWHCPSSTNTQPSWQRKNRRAVWNPNTVEDTREPRWLKTKTRTTRSGSQ
ncbi:ras-related protein Rab-26 isoform X8 [Manis javanica]|uniref:ras-related protein Rab-26 isoform X8 n=1 Tax=Manis javanica TaxID=9974 RepID=UPI003C6D7728